jgi:hypothetical protein
MKKLSFLVLLFPFCLSAQDDIMNMLQNEIPKTKNVTLGVFKGNRIINSQSTEQPAKRTMQFIISHRFGRISGSYKEFFGLDYSNIRIGVEYGIIDNLSIGFGRSSFEKTWDGYIKWRIIRQQTGKWNIPITITAFTSISILSNDWSDPSRHNFFSSRIYYSYQLLISHKFGSWVSVELMPTLVHRNLVHTTNDKNDVFAIGAGISLKLSKRTRLNVEYYYIIPNQIVSLYNNQKVRNNISLGVDIETGGHVFQINLSNSIGMIEKNFVTETTGNWFPNKFSDFGVQLGFNITRGFVIDPKAKKKAREAKNMEKLKTGLL